MKYIITGTALILTAVFLHRENTLLDVTGHVVKSEKIAENDKYTIAHISDFHNTHNTVLRNSITEQLRQRMPDLIVITGDIIDSRRTDIPAALSFIKEISSIAPIYYVIGNHEARRYEKDYPLLEKGLLESGVHVLHDESVKFDDAITLTGIDDLRLLTRSKRLKKTWPIVEPKIRQLISDEGFQILLIHRPEFTEKYGETGKIDLVFCGHAHGGQIILPHIGGLFSPSQGILPRFTSGCHKIKNTSVIISRGIGNSLFPFRLFDHPELIFTEIRSEH